ncbi:MAG TPA: hypothetical protein VMV44_13290 [Rectinemataceae bacterium]|nr:hypothetical protein [Rectinemataceae bacterium]
MTRGRPKPPDASVWEESLLAMDADILLAIARNYVGAVKSPWDKRSIVSRLVSFARKAETVEAILSLLDPLDVAIACTLLLAGPLSDPELRGLFHGELRAFDLGVRIANLEDRLVIFRMRDARQYLFAVNPHLVEGLAPLTRDARLVLAGGGGRLVATVEGPGAAESAPSFGASGGERLSPLSAAIGLFSFLFHNPGCVRKDGTLTKKADARLGVCIPDAAADPGRYEALLRAFEATGILVRGEAEGAYDPDAACFSELLSRQGRGLPYRLALSLSSARGEAEPLAAVLADALEGLPHGVALPASGLARWLGIAAIREGHTFDTESLAIALAKLGIVDRREMEFVIEGERAEAGSGGPGEGIPSIVADGAHLLRVLPEADFAARWFGSRIARPVRLGFVWELELDRDTMRLAFASGLSASAILSELGRLCVRPLPQSLAFSIESWEGEFRSTRLFHGWVLVCDERKRAIVEARADLSSLIRERLGPGIYLLDAADQEEVSMRLVAAGIEVPPAIRPHGHHRAFPETPEAARPRKPTMALPADQASFISLPLFDPSPRIEALRGAIAARMGEPGLDQAAKDRLRELLDRVEARLVLDESQLARADVTAIRTEAGGLDYGGKTRLAERAIANPGDRLEIKYQLPGGEPESVVMRPVRLQKTDRGLALEGEDLASGSPVRVPLGAASLVRRLRATPFGDER